MIIPLATTHGRIDLQSVKEIANKVLKLDLSTGIKDERQELVTLSKLRNGGDDQEALRLSPNMAKHLHFMFMIPCTDDIVLDLTSESGLEYTCVPVTNGNLLIVSGSLKHFVTMIVELSQYRTDDHTLIVVNELQKYFEERKLGFLFGQYEKRKHGPAYILERKK